MTEIKPPELKMGNMPIWFHHHGTKLELIYYDENIVIIKSNATRLSISKKITKKDVLWNINYSISHGDSCLTSNSLIMTSESLARAFGLDDNFEESGSSILKEFGGTNGLQGKYIRYKEYLNLPGPGTGHDGDPNLSIKIDDKIKTAIVQLLL